MDSSTLLTADDGALVAAIADGHEPALAEVYRRHGPAVTGLARRLLADNALAEDVTQEVFDSLWRNAGRFDPARGKLRTMLLTQTHGKSVDVIRSRNARDRREEKAEVDSPRSGAEVDAELMALTESQQVQQALAQLPPEERTCIELAYFGGNTYRQVAVLLDQPEGTVKGRIRSGLRRLHSLLTDADVELDISTPTVSVPTISARTTPPSTSVTHQKDQPWNAS